MTQLLPARTTRVLSSLLICSNKSKLTPHHEVACSAPLRAVLDALGCHVCRVKATAFTVDSDGQVTATVPEGAKTGKISKRVEKLR